MSDSEFTFHLKKDILGYDITHLPGKSVAELKQICKANIRCVGFNSAGWLKYYIDEQILFTNNDHKESHEGIYLYKERCENVKKINKNKSHFNFDDYTFYSGKDSSGYDIKHVPGKSLEELKELADQDPNCLGFNTFGFLKYKIAHECDFSKLNSQLYADGLYVKKRRFRIKAMGNWKNSKGVCDEWNMMSKGNYRWNDIEVTWEDKDIDFYVLVNKPLPGEHYDPKRTIVFQAEPWCENPNQHWGVKTWGEWAMPDESKFLQVRTHRKYLNLTFWQLKATYNDLKTMQIEKTKLLSTICTSKYFDPGHIKRIDFLKYIDNKNDDIVKIDIYNTDNDHKFKSYAGPHPPGNKDVGLLPYKYYFMGENNEEVNFITEKMWDPILSECLCFYWGCPNIADYIDPRAYIVLDLNNPEKAFETVKTAIINNEWEKRIEFIRREKQKFLEYYNIFPTLERIIKTDFKFNFKPTDDDVLYHKYFSEVIGKKINNVCFIHSCTYKGNPSILIEMLQLIDTCGLLKKLDYIYVVNLGDEIIGFFHPKIKIINYSRNIALFEKPTLNLMHHFCKYNKNAKVLYMHTKGVSYLGTLPSIDDWRRYLCYFMVEKHQVCMDLLDIYDTVGCNYRDLPDAPIHYSGNYWWTRAEHINTLQPITSDDRHDCEWWLFTNKNINNYNLHYSKVNHYKEPCPRSKYDTPETNKMIEDFYAFNDKIKMKCINLKRRPDRKALVERELQKTNLMDKCEFFEAIDGKLLEPTDNIIKMFEGNDFGTIKSVIGCALSHMELWKQLLQDDSHDYYLILEDDIAMDINFRFKLNKIMTILDNIKDWDILYLGYHIRKQQKEQYIKTCQETKTLTILPYNTAITIGGLFGYLLTKSGAQKFLKFIEENGVKHGIDYLMFRYHNEMDLKHYEVIPPIIVSDYVTINHYIDSDIQYDKNRLF